MPRWIIFAYAGLTLGANVVVPPATAFADSFANTDSCLSGTADAVDYASFDEDFNTGIWKSHSGVMIQSESQPVVLSVTDAYGNSICQNLANLSTSCTFRADFSSTFTITIDNTQNPMPADFQLCSF
jgi:hypothetical protein